MKKCKYCDGEAGVSGTAKGLCRSHYKRYLRYGNPLTDLKKVHIYPPDQRCSVRYCESQARVRGLCEKHYAAKKRGDDPGVYKRAYKRFRERKERELEEIAGCERPTTCQLCGSDKYRIVFDHCHATEKFRGWICDQCNKVLGLVYDNTVTLKKMILYLDGGPIAKVDQLAAKQSDQIRVRASRGKEIPGGHAQPGCER